MVTGNETARAQAAPSLDEVWKWLETVADPEIPVVSVVDLGIVRALRWEGGEPSRHLVVTITPTYSGCPAIAVIGADIASELGRRGIARVRLETKLSPAWSTDWISAAGRRQLKEYGIAAPHPVVHEALPVRFVPRTRAPVACPHCESTDTQEVSRFGSTPCKALYKCASCGEPFDYFKSL